MAKFTITEYSTKGRAENFAVVPIEVAQEPALRRQPKINFAAGEAKSLPFLPETRFIDMHTDANCQFDIGDSPLATPDYGTPMSAGSSRYLGVKPGQRLSVISNN